MTADEKLIPMEPTPYICLMCRHYKNAVESMYDFSTGKQVLDGWRGCKHSKMHGKYWSSVAVPEDCPLKDEVLPVL